MNNSSISSTPDVSIVIPTYKRERVLIDSLESLLSLSPPAREILVVDQTAQHEPATERRLKELHDQVLIRWIRLPSPSITAAMNHGLCEAISKIVLFVDDDIQPSPGLVAAHAEAQEAAALVVGQVLQPGERPDPLRPGETFRFNSTEPAWVKEFIGCNFSVRRSDAIALGGFDQNFIGAAYRYEAEFSHRFTAAHGPIRFEPRAALRHLRADTGGTRAHGNHLRTVSASHSVGAYYFFLMTRKGLWRVGMILRLLRSVRTRHHLVRPWWIPVTLLAEIRGLMMAIRLGKKGQDLLAHKDPPHRTDH